MRAWRNPRLSFWMTGIVALILCTGLFLWMRSPWFGLPFRDDFSSRKIYRWTTYAGNWTIVGDAVRNDSDERGAKLMTGSRQWTSYAMEADLQMLGGGDAGILVRASNVEEGVDSYDGYYAGLRTNDHSLILGRAEHGWYEFPAASMPGGVTPYRWYHLRLAAQGCVLSASATEIGTQNTAQIQSLDQHCLTAGMAGLRSMGAGGLWRNIHIIRLANESSTNVAAAVANHLAVYPTSQGSTPSVAAASPIPETAYWATAKPVQSIRSLRLLSVSKPAHAIVRGAVILAGPTLYIQDSTGGVRVETIGSALLRVGDEIEVEGDVYPDGLSATIRNANIKVVGGLAPIPPLSVTSDQAASGAYDSMFIEVEGHLVKRMPSGKEGVLEFRDGAQMFRAITDSDITRSAFSALKPESTVRLRGVCMIHSKYTHNIVPFVLIVDSPEKVKVSCGSSLVERRTPRATRGCDDRHRRSQPSFL